jgi:hypothetical protein
MEAIVFAQCPSLTIIDENYLMVDSAWTLAIETLDCLQALADAPVGTLPVCQLPGDGCLKMICKHVMLGVPILISSPRFELWWY